MEEVSEIKKELERTIPTNDGKRALELLRSLESIPMSIDILQTTHIGLTVNKIRKEIANPEVGSLSKSMVKKWKKLVAPSTNSGGGEGGGGATRTSSSSNNNSSSSNSHTGSNLAYSDSRISQNNGNSGSQAGLNQPSNTTSNSGSLTASTTGNSSSSAGHLGSSNIIPDSAPITKQTPTNISSQKESGSQAQPTGSFSRSDSRPAPLQTEVPSTSCEVRLKFRQMLAAQLKKPLPEDLRTEAFLEEEILAGRIEECVFQEFRSIDIKYKNRIRSKLSNLGDSKNPFLRYKVLRGDITPDRFAKMTTEEMASDDLKKERERYTKEAINDHQMSLTTGTRTSEIKCPACKKFDVTYNQMQTRSADEPMTTFCHCNECGRRWKFC